MFEFAIALGDVQVTQGIHLSNQLVRIEASIVPAKQRDVNMIPATEEFGCPDHDACGLWS